MTVYAFYLVRDEIDQSVFCGINYNEVTTINGQQVVLYAFTKKERYAKIFRKTRDLSLFYERKFHFTKEEYNDFYYHHDTKKLDFHFITTKVIKEDGKYSTKEVPLLCTYLESDLFLYYKEECLSTILEEICPIEIIEFLNKHKLKKKLQKLLDEYFLFSTLMFEIYPLEEINYDYYLIDELSLFIRVFKPTLRKDLR